MLMIKYKFIYSIHILDRFRIITWNAGNSEPNCTTFKRLAFASIADNITADLIVFGYENDYLLKIP
jgi:hypothetical protein